MTMKTLVKLAALAALLTFALTPANAGKFVDTYVATSSGAYFVGYDGGSTAPAKVKTDRVFTSSGAAVIQSTSSTSGHKVFRINNNAGTEVLSVTQGGALNATASAATALAANGANCSAGNYPLGVDASGAVEGCTSAGVGDVVAANANAFTGANTFGSSTTINGKTIFNVSPSTFHIAGVTSTAQPNTSSLLGVCVTASTRTITAVSTRAEVCYAGGAEFGGAGQGIIGFLVNGAFQNGQSSSEGVARFSKESSGSANASFCGWATGLTIGTQYNFCLTFASNSPAITIPANNNAGAQFGAESHP